MCCDANDVPVPVYEIKEDGSIDWVCTGGCACCSKGDVAFEAVDFRNDYTGGRGCVTSVGGGSSSGGGSSEVCADITNRSDDVYKVCCQGGAPTQTAGGFYTCSNPCTGPCTETKLDN